LLKAPPKHSESGAAAPRRKEASADFISSISATGILALYSSPQSMKCALRLEMSGGSAKMPPTTASGAALNKDILVWWNWTACAVYGG
jgi:hypothetical protein